MHRQPPCPWGTTSSLQCTGGCAAIINLNACSTYTPSLPPWQVELHFIGAGLLLLLAKAVWAQSVCAPGLHPGGLQGGE